MKAFFSRELCDIIQKLLEKNPEKRLGDKNDAEEVMKHPYFESIDWEALAQKKIIPIFKPDFSEDNLKYFNPNLEKPERKPEDDDTVEPYKSIENFTYTSDSFKDRLVSHEEDLQVIN